MMLLVRVQHFSAFIEQVNAVQMKVDNDDVMRHVVCMNVSVCITREGSAL